MFFKTLRKYRAEDAERKREYAGYKGAQKDVFII
jgi:hypothetical protein